jgi:hypothetical protein
LTQTELSQLPGAGRRFTVTGELMDFGESRTWDNQIEFKLNLKNPRLRGPETFWCPENVADELKDLVGTVVSLELLSDQVKPDKPEDDKHWNYWCKVVGRHKGGRPAADTGAQAAAAPDVGTQGKDAEGQQLNAAPRKPVTDSGTFKGSPFPPVEGIVQGHVEKLAMAWFTASFTPAELREIPHNIALQTIRLMRDELFHDLKSLSIAPTHYCYDHEMSRARSSRGNWGHPLEGGEWCIERDLDSHPPTDEELADISSPDEEGR